LAHRPALTGRAGYGYKHNEIDYRALVDRCLSRKGFAQVCEHSDATWLPFEFDAELKAKNSHKSSRVSSEAAFYLEGPQPRATTPQN
jgi:hypothetical protein